MFYLLFLKDIIQIQISNKNIGTQIKYDVLFTILISTYNVLKISSSNNHFCQEDVSEKSPLLW